jgi:hypothetical protein
MKSEPKAKEIPKRPARRPPTARPRKKPEKSNPALQPIVPPPPEVFPEAVTKPPRAPLAGFVLALGVLLFLGSQVVSQFQIHTSLAWQVHLLDRQSFALEEEIQNLQILESEGLQLLSRAEIVSQSYQALLKDLLTLSDTDPEAMAVVSKFQIRNLADTPANNTGESQR